VGVASAGGRTRNKDCQRHDALLVRSHLRERDVGRGETACRRSTICDRNIVPRESSGRRRKFTRPLRYQETLCYMAAVAGKIDRDAQVRASVLTSHRTNHKGSWNYISTRVGAGVGVGRPGDIDKTVPSVGFVNTIVEPTAAPAAAENVPKAVAERARSTLAGSCYRRRNRVAQRDDITAIRG